MSVTGDLGGDRAAPLIARGPRPSCLLIGCGECILDERPVAVDGRELMENGASI
jgi:hypothetical protein